MTEKPDHPDIPWYGASTKNAAIFVLMWFGESFLVLMFVKWVIHGSAAVYLWMIPWNFYGLIMVFAPELDSEDAALL